MRTLATLLTVMTLSLASPVRAEPAQPEPLLHSGALQGWVLSPSNDEPASRVIVLVRSVVGARGESGTNTRVRANYPAVIRSLGLEIRPLTGPDLEIEGTTLILTEIVHAGQPDVIERYAPPEIRGDLAPLVDIYLETQLAGPTRTFDAALFRMALEEAALGTRI